MLLLFIVRASTATVNGWMGKRTLQSNNKRLRGGAIETKKSAPE